MTALQHGVATLSTVGNQTDTILSENNGSAFLLAPDDDAAHFVTLAQRLMRDADLRHQLGLAGQALYRAHFTWERIAEKLLTDLDFETYSITD